MIVEVAILDVIPGRELGFAAAFQEASAIIASMPSCVVVIQTANSSASFGCLLFAKTAAVEPPRKLEP